MVAQSTRAEERNVSDKLCDACGIDHAPEIHDAGFDWNESLHQRGTLLDWCQALKSSHEGSGDRLAELEIAEVRKYMRGKLDRWRTPSSHWDRMVRSLVEHALRAYHAPGPESVRNQPEKRVAQHGNWDDADEAEREADALTGPAPRPPRES
jgi:hypothetical protein